MSLFETRNPTALEVGKEGTLFGRRATVIGRSRLRSADGYGWEEYHLKLDDGSTPTLVYESGVWKRFDLFDPDTTMKASEAAVFSVGDPITLRSWDATVTYVGESQVASIQGRAPEGYRVGSKAHYFNAEAGNRMYVVSWTGNEVEYYEGQSLSRGEVERAFGLPPPSLLAGIFSGGSGALDGWFDHGNRLLGLFLFGCAFFVFIFFVSGAGSSSPTAEPPPAIPAPALPFLSGAQGELAGRHYLIVGHQQNDIATMQGQFGRHEYDLVDDDGNHALLVQGLSMDARQWYLLRPSPDAAKTWPARAATLKTGTTFAVEDQRAVVRVLFLCRTLVSDGDLKDTAKVGSVRYGFTAQTPSGWVLARWGDFDMELRVGTLVGEKDVMRAFAHATRGP